MDFDGSVSTDGDSTAEDSRAGQLDDVDAPSSTNTPSAPFDVLVSGKRVVTNGHLRLTKNKHAPILIEQVADESESTPMMSRSKFGCYAAAFECLNLP